MSELENKELVILIPGFPENEKDSVCLPAQQAFVKAVNEHFPKVRLHIFSFQYPYEPKEYSWYGNNIISFGGKNKGGLYRLLVWGKITRRLRRLVQKGNLTGILSFWCGECAWLGNRISIQYGIPHFCWIMGQDVRRENKYVARIRPVPEQLIAISDFIRNEMARNHHVLPGLSIPLGVAPLQRMFGDNKRDIDLLGVGSLIPLKQYDLFIQMVKESKSSFPNLKTVICGKGPEEPRLKELIEKNGLTGQITLSGELPHDEISQFMGRSRILLHPSSFEGFSGSCLEALQAGMHVVSFCKPMNRDIPNWHIVKNIQGMQEKIIELLRSELKQEPVEPYPMKKTVESVMKLFEIR